MTSSPPLFIVFNMGSGRQDRRAALRTIEEELGAAHRTLQVLEVVRGGDLPATAARAVELAARAGGAVVAAGGDGTVNGVVQAVLHAGLPFGVVPLGTFNYFARTHGIPNETQLAARALATARERPVQVGLVNGRTFLVNASLGFYPLLLEDREAFTRQYGRARWVALASAFASLMLRRQPRLLLKIEGPGEDRLLNASTLFVGNNALQLEQVGIPEAEDVARGELAAVCVQTQAAWPLLALALRGAMGRLGTASSVESFSFRLMEVALPARRWGRVDIKVAVDGENTRMSPPLVFGVAPQPLRLLCPTGDAE